MGIPDFTHVLVGWDGSSCAVESLTSACRIAGDGDVRALAVIPTWEHVEDAQEREEAVAEVTAPLTRRYEEAAAHLRDHAGRRLSLEFVPGDDEAEALLAYALAHHYDLVVLGLHGNEGEIHRKIGHVASRVVKASRCPVLLVPEPDASADRQAGHVGAVSDALRHLFGSHHSVKS
jgi:nucleotide-binding universal stress UspA family protein